MVTVILAKRFFNLKKKFFVFVLFRCCRLLFLLLLLFSKYVTQVQERPESPTVTLTWHAYKYNVHKLRQMYIFEFMYLIFTRIPGETYRRRLRSLSYFCYVFWDFINSLVWWFCGSSALSLVLMFPFPFFFFLWLAVRCDSDLFIPVDNSDGVTGGMVWFRPFYSCR